MATTYWDTKTDPNNPGWVVLVEIEPGRKEWMSPAPGQDIPRDATDAEVHAMIDATQRWHGASSVPA